MGFSPTKIWDLNQDWRIWLRGRAWKKSWQRTKNGSFETVLSSWSNGHLKASVFLSQRVQSLGATPKWRAKDQETCGFQQRSWGFYHWQMNWFRGFFSEHNHLRFEEKRHKDVLVFRAGILVRNQHLPRFSHKHNSLILDLSHPLIRKKKHKPSLVAIQSWSHILFYVSSWS